MTQTLSSHGYGRFIRVKGFQAVDCSLSCIHDCAEYSDTNDLPNVGTLQKSFVDCRRRSGIQPTVSRKLFPRFWPFTIVTFNASQSQA